MSQVNIDPEALRRFSSFLRQRISGLSERSGVLRRKKNEVGMNWKDDRYHEFEGHYDDAIAEIDRFCEDANRMSERLLKKAELADRYLRR